MAAAVMVFKKVLISSNAPILSFKPISFEAVATKSESSTTMNSSTLSNDYSGSKQSKQTDSMLALSNVAHCPSTSRAIMKNE